MPNWHPHELNFITAHYGRGTTPFQMCPPSLFGEIARINSLRAQRAVMAHNDNQSQLEEEEEAQTILQRIHGFSPEQWAESKPAANDDWRLVGRIYQAALTIYCTRSLHTLPIRPSPTDNLLNAQSELHAITQQLLLHELLGIALANNRIQRFLLWPLIVHGVEACHGHGDGRTREFVKEQLCEMSRQVGSYAPLAAKGVLERFWASGETGWDACFDRPYLFLNQFAVDMIGISPEP
jgi:hypothetical protein